MKNIVLSYPSKDITSLIREHITINNLPNYSLRIFLIISSQGSHQAICIRGNTTWFCGFIIPMTKDSANRWTFATKIGETGAFSQF